MKIKDNIFVICNIFVIIISLLICIHFQKSAYIICHDYFYYTDLDITNPLVPRIPGLIIGNLFNEKLPMLFNENLQDFKCGLGNYIISVIYVLICLIFCKSFFISDNKSMFFNKKFSLIYPISFMLLSFPLMYDAIYNLYFNGISEIGVWGEYNAGFIVYFSFWLLVIKNVLEDKKENRKTSIFKLIIYFLVAFLLGFWSELFTLITLFALIPFIIYLRFFFREKLKNPMLKILFFGFFIGFISLVLVELKIGSIAAQPDYSLDMFRIDFYNIKNFLILFFKYLLLKKLIFFIAIITTLIILNNKTKTNRAIIFLLFCIIFGYFVSNFSCIVLSDLRSHEYVFLKNLYNCIEINILEFVLLIALGMINSDSKENDFNKYKKIINVVLICAFISLSCTFLYNYKKCVLYRNQIKSYSYKIEKMILIYHIYGETAVLPYNISHKYWKEFHYGMHEVIPITNHFIISGEKYVKPNRYLNETYFSFYTPYWYKNYHNRFIGVIFKNDKIAETEFNKRMMYIGEKIEDNKELIEKRIKFSNLKKYDNIDLTLQDVEKMEEKYGKDDFFIKAKAYIFYKNFDYNQALDLYKLYLSKHPDDFDALINLYTIYKEKGDLKNSEKYLQKLIDADSKNLIHLYYMMKLLYEKKDYNKAININNEMIKLYPEVQPNYVNGAVLYKKAGEMNLYNEFLDEIKNKNPYVYKKIEKKEKENNLELIPIHSMFI